MNGIIFQGPMIRRIDAGLKTQTRRPTKPQPRADSRGEFYWPSDKALTMVSLSEMAALSPYGPVGTRFYVKERVELIGSHPADPRAIAMYAADGAPCPYIDTWPWQRRTLSPLFMPKGVRRFEIEVTDLRVQRLQDISREDAIAEGAYFTDYGKHEHQLSADGGGTWGTTKTQKAGWSMVPTTGHGQCLGSPQMAFANYYNRLHGGDNWNLKDLEQQPWNLNPWVWAISFAVHRREDT